MTQLKKYNYGDKAWYLINGKIMIPCVITKNYNIAVGAFMPWDYFDEIRYEDMEDVKTMNMLVLKRSILKRETEMPVDKLFLEREDDFKKGVE